MASSKRGLIIAGVILLVLGAILLYYSNVARSFQSTFNILPTKYSKIASNLRDQTLITGQFQETSGRIVSFYIMSSAQFASFQIGQNTGNLYSLQNVASGSISFTSTVPDTYYLVFTHGPGLFNSTETVNFQRTYLF
jgi:predicted PurR-regulated permease PerM